MRGVHVVVEAHELVLGRAYLVQPFLHVRLVVADHVKVHLLQPHHLVAVLGLLGKGKRGGLYVHNRNTVCVCVCVCVCV